MRKVICISLPSDDEIINSRKKSYASNNYELMTQNLRYKGKLEIGTILNVTLIDGTRYWVEKDGEVGWVDSIFSKHFVSLSEYRQNQLEKIGI